MQDIDEKHADSRSELKNISFIQILVRLLRSINWLNFIVGSMVVVSFALLFGFYDPPVPLKYLHYFHFFAFVYFVVEKFYHLFKAPAKSAFLRENWIEIPMLLALIGTTIFAERLFPSIPSQKVIGTALGVYLIVQVVDKVCRFTVYV